MGGKIDEINDQIVFLKDKSQETIASLEDLEKNKKVQMIMNFEFKPNEKRRLYEYDDLQVYLSKNNNYLVADHEKNEKIIEEIDYGLINFDKLRTDQRNSSNVWISILDKNLVHITAKKLDLSYFENQNYFFWMNLNEKFFFQTNQFKKFQEEKFPLIGYENVEKALEEISMSCCHNTNKGDVDLVFKYVFIRFYFEGNVHGRCFKKD